MPARMRFAAQAVEEIRRLDPGTQVSLKLVRRLMNSGAVPSVSVGCGNRRLVNLDALLDYLEHPAEDAPEAVHGIRRIDERRVV